jgi:putative SOS response-associated peptidase YedK
MSARGVWGGQERALPNQTARCRLLLNSDLQVTWRMKGKPVGSTRGYTDSQPKVPHWFALGDDGPAFAFDGIWRPWTAACGTKAERRAAVIGPAGEAADVSQAKS